MIVHQVLGLTISQTYARMYAAQILRTVKCSMGKITQNCVYLIAQRLLWLIFQQEYA